MAVASHLTRRSACLAKAETSYGTDAVPTSLLNGILLNEGAELAPSADKIDRAVLRDTYSPAGSIIGAKSVELTLTVEARGGGVDGAGNPVPPDYDPLLLACGMQRSEVMRLTLASNASFLAGETITGGTSGATATIEYIERENLLVASMLDGTFAAESITGGTSGVSATLAVGTPGIMYRPKTAAITDLASASMYFWKDSILHRLLGAVGTWSLEGEVGKIGTFQFKMSGLWVDPADSELPAPTLTTLTGPQALAMDMRIGAYTPVFTALKLDLGAKIDKRQDANADEGLVGLMITGRSPTGTLDPEVDALAAYNPWDAWKSGTKSRLNCYLGSVAGNRWAIHVGQAQYSDLKYKDRNGIVAYDLPFIPCQERLGDDEIRLILF